MKTSLLQLLCIVLLGCNQLKIVDKPITYDETREELSLEYMQNRHGLDKEEPTIEPKMIVVHWTATPTFEDLFAAFDPPKLQARPDLVDASLLNVSSQFSVDRDGTIYRLMPETKFARHVIGLNYCAIGIENVGDGNNYPLTDEQFVANKKLIRYLKEKYPDIAYMIGHYEYKKFIGHALWKESDPDYLTDKIDPGKEFMERLREDLADLQLKEAPN